MPRRPQALMMILETAGSLSTDLSLLLGCFLAGRQYPIRNHVRASTAHNQVRVLHVVQFGLSENKGSEPSLRKVSAYPGIVFDFLGRGLP